MLSVYLAGNIVFMDQATSWEDSIRMAAQPLWQKGFITESYMDAMIENVHTNGPYIVIAPGVAMPHARNEGGVRKTGISLLKLKHPVRFPEEKDVQLLFVLAALDSTQHLDLMADLSTLLMDGEVMARLKHAQREEEVIQLVQLVEV